MAWSLTVGPYTLHEHEVTAGHLVAVAELLGSDQWAVAEPMSSPRSLSTWAALVLAIRTDLSFDEAALAVGQMPMVVLLSGYQADAPPPSKEEQEAPDNGGLTSLIDRLVERQRAG